VIVEVVELIGRLLFVALFVNSGINHFRQREGMVAYSRASGLPAPELAVPLTGLMILVGGLLVALGVWPDLGALLIAAFVLPTAFLMHAYWKVDDPMMRGNQQAHFMKNVSLGGAALSLFALYAQVGDDAAYLLGGPLF
jgi:putative oxidoreductase